MTAPRVTRRLALCAGAAALVASAALTAGCGSSTKETPTSTTSVPSTSAAVTPTEKKSVGSFAPTATNPGPGANCDKVVNGVCMR